MKSIKKERIDKVLVSRGFVETRTKAQSLLMAGKVTVDGNRVDKPGALVFPDAAVEVIGTGNEWVSRGALKLLKALDAFPFDPKDRICVDIGASTGGFTQVLLSRGALRVYSVDVGYGQLSWSLRSDERVVVMERMNARNLLPDNFPDIPDRAVADASFISLKLLLPAMDTILSPQGEAVVLVKPQFEVGKGKVGKGGVVRSSEDHIVVLEEILNFCLRETTFTPCGITFSPITGPMGNIEYLLYLSKSDSEPSIPHPVSIVEEAHSFFTKGRAAS